MRVINLYNEEENITIYMTLLFNQKVCKNQLKKIKDFNQIFIFKKIVFIYLRDRRPKWGETQGERDKQTPSDCGARLKA